MTEEQRVAIERVAAQADLLVAMGASSLAADMRPSLPVDSSASSSLNATRAASSAGRQQQQTEAAVYRQVYDPTSPSQPGRMAFDDGSSPPVTASGRASDPDQPFALEATTQARLTEIRDAIASLTRVGGGGSGVGHGPNLGDGRTDWERDIEKWQRQQGQTAGQDAMIREKMMMERAPLGGSSGNLYHYGMRMRNIGQKAASRLQRLRNGPSAAPDPKNYTPSGRRKSRFDDASDGPTSTGSSMAEVMNVTATTVNLTGPVASGGGGGGAGGNAAAGAAKAAKPEESGGAMEGAEAGMAAGPEGAAIGAAAGAIMEDPVGAALMTNPVTGPLTIFATAAIEAGKATYEFARAQEGEVRRLSEYGAGQAIGTANLDTGRILRDIDTAEETGESSQGLTESIDKFEAAIQPIESLMTDIANTVGGRLLDLVTLVVEPVGELFKIFKVFYDGLPGWLKSGTAAADHETSISGLAAVAAETARINDPRWPR